MSIFLEFHLVQNFAPSNLNRDDTGAPKEALFGGYRRARVSSQCFKRAMRLHSQKTGLLAEENLAVRTLKLKQLLEEGLSKRGRENCSEAIEIVLGAIGLKVKDNGNTEYLLFLGAKEVEGLVNAIDQHWDALSLPAEVASKRPSKSKKVAVPKELVKQAKELLDGGKAVNIALYGRMLANLPEANQEAACQVAHAISTHRVEREFDYFTAVDDRNEGEETGAGMIGQVEFNSATYYRYAVLDVKKFAANLQGDEELVIAAAGAFTRSIAMALPTGKQNSFAANNLPAFIGVTMRRGSPMNLVNAFELPVWPKNDQPLTALSVAKLASYDDELAAFYGASEDRWAYIDSTGAWPEVKGDTQKSLDELALWVEERVREISES